VIYTPGNVQYATINVANALKKTVDLTPWNLDPTSGVGAYLNPSTVVPRYANDVIYGGLGNDGCMVGRATTPSQGPRPCRCLIPDLRHHDQRPQRRGAQRLYSPVQHRDMLRYNVDDPTGWHRDRTRRSGEFALYDEYDPLRKIELIVAATDATLVGQAFKDQAGITPSNRGDFFMNFNAVYGNGVGEGIYRAGGVTPDGVTYLATYDDGADRIFGDLGNDWMVAARDATRPTAGSATTSSTMTTTSIPKPTKGTTRTRSTRPTTTRHRIRSHTSRTAPTAVRPRRAHRQYRW